MARGLVPILAVVIGLLVSCGALRAAAEPILPSERKDRLEPLPKRLQGVDVVEHLDVELPRGVEFKDETGRRVRLGDYFDGKKPVILTLNYSSCPMLCSLILNGLTLGLKDVTWTAGRDFRIVTISIDPKETPETAARTKERYESFYGRPEAREGWHVLSGSEESIHAVADAVGFRYGYNEERKEYVHPAAFAMVTPDGRIARYLYGIEFQPKTLSLSLVEASEGKLSSTVDRLILYCFHYDSSEGRYAPVAINIMRLGGALTALLLAGFLIVMWTAELGTRRRQRAAAETQHTTDLPLGKSERRPAT